MCLLLTSETVAWVVTLCAASGMQSLTVVFRACAGAQTGAATIMVAERAAEILLQKSGSSEQARQPELAVA